MEVLRDKAFIHVSSKASKSAFNQQTRRALSRTRSGLSYRIRSNQRHHQSLEDGSNDPEEAKSTSYVPANKRTSRPEVLEFPPTTLHALKTSGLHKTPQSGGVQNATARCDLPSPAVAVRNLVEQAQFAHLCTIMSNMHHRRAGYPFGTVVDFAADGAGHPIFCLSPLAIQTRNIMEDPRCSLVMQMPGWSGLANARVTMFGDVYKLPKELQGVAADIFHRKLSSDEEETRFVSGNAIYFRMDRILDIYFVGGFGTVQWVDTEEYTKAQPDKIVLKHPNHTLQVLNQTFSGLLRDMLSQSQSSPVDDAAFISIDRLGADVRIRRGGDYSVERFGFDSPVETLDDVMGKLNGKFEKM